MVTKCATTSTVTRIVSDDYAQAAGFFRCDITNHLIHSLTVKRILKLTNRLSCSEIIQTLTNCLIHELLHALGIHRITCEFCPPILQLTPVLTGQCNFMVVIGFCHTFLSVAPILHDPHQISGWIVPVQDLYHQSYFSRHQLQILRGVWSS